MSSVISKLAFMTKKNRDDFIKGLYDLDQSLQKNENQFRTAQANIDKKIDSLTERLNNIEMNVAVLEKTLKSIVETLNMIDSKIENTNKENIIQLSHISKEIQLNSSELNNTLNNCQSELLERYEKDENKLIEGLNNLRGEALKTKNMCDAIIQRNEYITDWVKDVDKTRLTKEDLEVVSSFLRFIAANQLMQEVCSDMQDSLQRTKNYSWNRVKT